jgi:tryptophanyl-tRNA synthetase
VAGPDKPAITNLLTIYAVATGRSVEDIEREHEGKGYADLKAGLAEAVVEFLAPLQARYRELSEDPGEISRLLEVGADKARAVARKTLDAVYDKVGFLRPRP